MIYIYNLQPKSYWGKFIKVERIQDQISNFLVNKPKPTYKEFFNSNIYFFTDEEIKYLINKHDEELLKTHEKIILENDQLRNQIESS